MTTQPEHERLRLERDLLLGLLSLPSHDDVRPFLAGALSLVVAITGALRGYIELSGARQRFWVGEGFRGDEIDAVRREISTGIVAEAIRSGQTISTASALDDPRFMAQASVKAKAIQAVLCAPIGAPAFGVIYLQGRQVRGPFSEEHRALCELFARHVAPLCERALDRAEGAGASGVAELLARVPSAGLVGRSAALCEALKKVLQAAALPVPLLLLGESGTGKSALARAAHEASPRARGPFVEINCAALPEALFESELFGAEKGAHSTATRRIEGKVASAERGTLFLDEVGELSLSVQGKLLTFLQTKRYYRLGASAPSQADVRVVAATNRDLEEAVAARAFREDLYYRLNVLEVRVPPLRERIDDIVPIAEQALERLSREAGASSLSLSRGAKRALEDASWPGNARQLENVVQRGLVQALGEGARQIEARHLFAGASAEPEGAEAQSYDDALLRFQARFLRDALEATGFNVSETARRVGLSRSHLNELIKAHGLTRGGKGAGKAR